LAFTFLASAAGALVSVGLAFFFLSSPVLGSDFLVSFGVEFSDFLLSLDFDSDLWSFAFGSDFLMSLALDSGFFGSAAFESVFLLSSFFAVFESTLDLGSFGAFEDFWSFCGCCFLSSVVNLNYEN
jgi:hypothetical protein